MVNETNGVSKDVLEDTLARMDLHSLKDIARNCELSIELAVKYADDKKVLHEIPVFSAIVMLKNACNTLIVMK